MNKTPIYFWLITLYLLTPEIGYSQLDVEFEPMANTINSPNPIQALDIHYDQIEKSRQAFHIFLPDTTGPYPLVIYFHGGGFTGGSRDVVFSTPDLQRSIRYFLENGIAFVSAGYRLIESNKTDSEGVIKSLGDAERALQFIRHYADDLKITPGRIAIMGTSAGAGTALWLATRDDMANPSATDLVLRETTRVSAIHLGGSQATYDIPKWESVIYKDFDFTLDDIESILGFDRMANFYGGLDSINQVYHDPALIEYRENVDMLSHMSSDDPPVHIFSSSAASEPGEDVFHHGAQSVAIRTAALAAQLPEVKAEINYLNINTTGGESGEAFLVRHLTKAPEILEPEVLSMTRDLNPVIYPNPASSVLYIGSAIESPVYKIYDLKGQLVLSGAGQEVNVSSLSKGLYWVVMNDRILRLRKR